MQATILRRSALLLICTLLTACASLKDRADLLEQAQRDYEGAVRWGHLDSAYAMHRNADGSVPTPAPRLNNYRVTSYHVLSRSVAKDEAGADQVVEIKYYNADYMRESTLRLQQHWRYDAPTHTWLVTSPPPDFK